MEFVGEYLKEERIKKKITLEKVCKDLHIGRDLIREIESDILPEYLDRVFIIGHIRSYARYLDLDSEVIIENYKIQNFSNKKKSQIEIQKPIHSNSIAFLNGKISLVSILIISTFFYLFFIDSDNIDQKYAMTPDIPENLQPLFEEAEMQIVLESKINAEKDTQNVAETKINLIDPSLEFDLDKSSSSAIASLPKIDNDIKNIVTLKFVDSTWVQLRDSNDEIILSKLMNKNDEYSYDLSNLFFLTIGNAGNLIISIDGVVKGKAGRSGEVIDSLIIDKNFKN